MVFTGEKTHSRTVKLHPPPGQLGEILPKKIQHWGKSITPAIPLLLY